MKKLNLVVYFFPALMLLLNACTKQDSVQSRITITPCPDVPFFDYRGVTYNTVLIGSQCWMKENLNVGIMIPANRAMTLDTIIEKYCYHDTLENCNKYGAYYQWNELMKYDVMQGSQGICPDGWHIPTDAEWKTLEGFNDTKYGVGNTTWNGNGLRGNDAGKNLKDSTRWNESPLAKPGTNRYGFSAVPATSRSVAGTFAKYGTSAYFWTSSMHDPNSPYLRNLDYQTDKIYKNYSSKDLGLSVRCLKN